jgi:hypothetical protein
MVEERCLIDRNGSKVTHKHVTEMANEKEKLEVNINTI